MDDDVLRLAQLLACPVRLAALRTAGEHGVGVVQLAELLNIAPSTASYHLGILARAGLLDVRRVGRRHIYKLGPCRWYFARGEAAAGR